MGSLDVQALVYLLNRVLSYKLLIRGRFNPPPK
jgi:hypothetical protein